MEKEFDDFRKALKDEWEIFRATSTVFSDEERKLQVLENGNKIDKWGFCISEIQQENSIFFICINPSSKENHTHNSFVLKETPESKSKNQREIAESDFKYQRMTVDIVNIIRKTKKDALNFSYWDIFPVRMTDQNITKEKFKEIAETEKGRNIIRDMFALTKQAIEITKPRAVYVCNGAVKDMAEGNSNWAIAGIWKEANPLPLSHSPDWELPLLVTEGIKRYFSYNTMKLHGSSIPVLLGPSLGKGRDYGDKQAAFAAELLAEALDDPERCYNELRKRGQPRRASKQC